MTLITLEKGAEELGTVYETLRRHRAKGVYRGWKLFYQEGKRAKPKMVLENIEAFKKSRLVD